MNNYIKRVINQYGGSSIPFSKMKGAMNNHSKSKKKTKRYLKKSKELRSKTKIKQPIQSPKKLKDGIILRGIDNKLWKTKKHKWIRLR
tara:strand:- start:235 stop:498 length:264 start_codon:yes stop_codon:yes gene_type:complete